MINENNSDLNSFYLFGVSRIIRVLIWKRSRKNHYRKKIDKLIIKLKIKTNLLINYNNKIIYQIYNKIQLFDGNTKKMSGCNRAKVEEPF